MTPVNQRSGKKYAAQMHATAAVDDEPLLPNKQSRVTDCPSSLEGDSGEDDEGGSSIHSEDLLPKLSGNYVVSTTAVALLVTGGLAASTLALIVVRTVTVILMAIFFKANLLLVARNHFRVAKSDNMRISVQNIQKEMGVLKDEIDFLRHSVDDLQAEADVLIGFEQELRRMATTQGKSVTEIVDLVGENESILNQMRGNLTRSFVTAMVMVVVRSDKNGDGKMALQELPLLGLRLQILLEPYGINLDTNKFEAMIREDNDVRNVLKFCADMLFEEESTARRDDDSVDSELTFDFDSLGRTPMEARKASWRMTYEEKASMATVDGEICKGSVEVARGRRMTLVPSRRRRDTRKRTIVKEVKQRQSELETMSKRHVPGAATKSPVSSLEW